MPPLAEFAPHMLAFSCANIAANLAIRFVTRHSKNCAHVSKQRQDRAILYALSVVNAAIGCGYGIHHYLTNSGSTQTDTVLRDRAYFCVAYVTGYFVYDFLFVLPDAFKYPQDIVHHLIGMLLGMGALTNIDSVYRIVPAFSLQEISTLPLNLMWFSKEFPTIGERTNVFYAKLFFALTFMLTRVINLPYQYYYQWSTGISDFSVNVHIAMLLFIGLQYYWFVGIVKKALGVSKKDGSPKNRS